MNAVTITEAKANLEQIIEQVIDDVEPTIIRTNAGQQIAFLSLEEFNAWNKSGGQKMRISGLVTLWLVIFIAAFVVPRFIEPTGSGFTRGINRLPILLGLHCLGFILALFTAGLTYNNRARIVKWLLVAGFTPITIDVLLIVLLVIFYVSAVISGMVSRQIY